MTEELDDLICFRCGILLEDCECDKDIEYEDCSVSDDIRETSYDGDGW